MKNGYKELPCRRCGRVWKWAFEKKSEPCCPEGYGCTVEGPTTRELFDEVLKRLDAIEMKINRVQSIFPTAPAPPITIYPTDPDPLFGVTRCSKCGIEWRGVMGYCCPRGDCPVQMKVT